MKEFQLLVTTLLTAGLLWLPAVRATTPFLSTARHCGCSNVSLCQPLPPRSPLEQEIMGYCLGEPQNAPLYNWSMLTTMAYYGALEGSGAPKKWTTYCLAKEHRVKFALAQEDVPTVRQLQNATVWKEVADAMLAKVTTYGYDGLHFDWELELGINQSTKDALAAVVTYLSRELKKQGLQFTAAVDTGTWLTIPALVLETDFVMIMDYDQSWKGPGPNAAYAGSVRAIDSYVSFLQNVSSWSEAEIKNKIVLGLPWYGHYYGCINEYNASLGLHNMCEPAPNVVALGAEPYKLWSKMARGESKEGPFTNYTFLNSGTNMEVGYARVDFQFYPEYQWMAAYYDTPATLKAKYAMAGRKGIRGVAMWNIEYVSYNQSDARGVQEREEMWEALDAFRHPI